MDLVTGATGLLGSHIVQKLRGQGRSVRALVRPGSDASLLESWGTQIARGDVTDPASIAQAMKGVTTVYHAAAQVGDWGKWSDFVAVTIEGTRNMLDAAKQVKLKRFLHISSISTYGHVNGQGLVLDEKAPPGQLGVNLGKWHYYSRAKVEAEKIAWECHNRGDVPVTVVKPSWLYGPRDRATMPRLINAIRSGKAKLLGDGNNRLNLTYAGNEADGCILAATSDKAAGQIYNLSDDGFITLQQYFNMIAQCIGAKPVTRKVPYRLAYNAGFVLEMIGHALHSPKPPFVTRYATWLMGRRCFFSCEKARHELGWKPVVSYDEGIKLAVQWCLQNGAA